MNEEQKPKKNLTSLFVFLIIILLIILIYFFKVKSSLKTTVKESQPSIGETTTTNLTSTLEITETSTENTENFVQELEEVITSTIEIPEDSLDKDLENF
jgi:predicted Holliday junction resolvase-like endonuclease